MPTRLNPYISFPGNAREAMEFYAEIFGGSLTLNTFGEFGAQDESRDKIMHGQLESGAISLMGADTPSGMPHQPGNNIAMSLSGDDAGELEGYWGRLVEGGEVVVELEKQMWGDVFGMCTDRFGTSWMVNIAGSQG